MGTDYKRIVSIVAILLIIFYIIMGLLSEVKCHQNVQIWNAEGEHIDVTMDVTLHKKLFGTSEMSGKLIIDNVEYLSYSELYQYVSVDSYLFRIPTEYALDGIQDTIILDLHDDKFDAFRMLIYTDGELSTYYGTITSLEMEEVQKIWNE
ncbi:MAG: hypothetical protein IJX63_03700 [Lachnospiraceae bacterium]|nr:hypothetical protein [Lachnospiraceae bacterium]